MDNHTWISSFEKAIQARDTNLLHQLLQMPPLFHNIDIMKQVLLLTMDAENMLCEVRQDLVDQRTTLQLQH